MQPQSHVQSDNSNRISAEPPRWQILLRTSLQACHKSVSDLKLHHIMRTKVLHMWSNLIWTQGVVYTGGVCGCGGLLSLVLFP